MVRPAAREDGPRRTARHAQRRTDDRRATAPARFARGWRWRAPCTGTAAPRCPTSRSTSGSTGWASWCTRTTPVDGLGRAELLLTTVTRIPLASGAVHVESHGDPRGRLVLCVHGLSANCRSFDRLVPALVADGHHVVTMDLRGRGRSEITPAGTYGWDSHVRDLLEIADFCGADSFDVIGHSMGGFIGMTLAAHHPQALPQACSDRCPRGSRTQRAGAHRAVRQPAGPHLPVGSGGVVLRAELGHHHAVE